MEAGSLREVRQTVARLMDQRDYAGVERLLQALPREVLLSELELCLKLASVLGYQYKRTEAKSLLDKVRSSFVDGRDVSLLRRWQLCYACELLHECELSEAEDLLQQCLSSAEDASHLRIIASANNNLGIVSTSRGEIEASVRYYTRAIATWQQLGDLVGVWRANHNLAVVHREWGELSTSIAHFFRAQEYLADIATREEQVVTAVERAMLFLAMQDGALAERVAGKAIAMARLLGNNFLSAAAHKAFGTILLASSRIDDARTYLTIARAKAATTSNKLFLGELHEEIAILALSDGDFTEAGENCAVAGEYYQQVGSLNHCRKLEKRYRELSREQSIR